MAITPVSLQQPMRPAEIDAINALNSAIAELNQLDITTLNSRLNTIEGNITTIQNDLNTPNTGLKARVATAEGNISDNAADISALQATLYTNLDVTI